MKRIQKQIFLSVLILIYQTVIPRTRLMKSRI
nr:MAG TPA: hypothetical protein [Caudoviricetes sp.]DAV60282.1 MAG TPA: hypothetical protein [Caudoviricetes sp.]